MELKEIALRTREEIEQELDKMCPLPENPKNADEIDRVLEERAKKRKSILKYQVEALLDGKLTVDQVVDRLHINGDEPYQDEAHQKCLEGAIEELKKGKDREGIVAETVNSLNLI